MIRFTAEGEVVALPRRSELTYESRAKWEREHDRPEPKYEAVGLYSDGNRYTRLRIKTDGIQSETFDVTVSEPYCSRAMFERTLKLKPGDRVKISGQFTHWYTHFHPRLHRVTVKR